MIYLICVGKRLNIGTLLTTLGGAGAVLPRRRATLSTFCSSGSEETSQSWQNIVTFHTGDNFDRHLFQIIDGNLNSGTGGSERSSSCHRWSCWLDGFQINLKSVVLVCKIYRFESFKDGG